MIEGCSAAEVSHITRNPSGADLEFMAELMKALEENNVPAPGPIEQRWSSSSSADMSPAASPGELDQIHSWVGIIMYLPEDDPGLRAKVTERSAASLSYCTRVIWEEDSLAASHLMQSDL